MDELPNIGTEAPPEGWRSGRQLKADGFVGNASDFNHEMRLLSIKIKRSMVASGVNERLVTEFVTQHLFRAAREDGRNTTFYGSPEAIQLMEGSGILVRMESAHGPGDHHKPGWSDRLPRSGISPSSEHLDRKGGQQK